MKFILIFLATLTTLAACSERGSYQSVRDTQARECQNLPESERERCERNLMPPYDEYQRAKDDEG